jgi:hypothetical protein
LLISKTARQAYPSSRWRKGNPKAGGIHTVLGLILDSGQASGEAKLYQQSLAPGADAQATTEYQAEVCP